MYGFVKQVDIIKHL